MLKSITVTALICLCIGLTYAGTDLTPLIVKYPAPQTSVTSTAFNPAITNAGGTTNSAGTFNVVSLSQSTSYAFNGNLPQTTTFAPAPAPFAASPNAQTPGYYSETPTTPTAQVGATATRSSIQLSGTASVIAATTVPNAGVAISPPSVNGLWTVLLSATCAIVGAVMVL